MKYKEIDLKQARKCCKQHCYKNIKGYTVPICEKCPLRRLNNNGHQGFCWFTLKSMQENWKDFEKYPLAAMEYEELMNEDISFPEEWENWVEAQNTVVKEIEKEMSK